MGAGANVSVFDELIWRHFVSKYNHRCAKCPDIIKAGESYVWLWKDVGHERKKVMRVHAYHIKKGQLDKAAPS